MPKPKKAKKHFCLKCRKWIPTKQLHPIDMGDLETIAWIESGNPVPLGTCPNCGRPCWPDTHPLKLPVGDDEPVSCDLTSPAATSQHAYAQLNPEQLLEIMAQNSAKYCGAWGETRWEGHELFLLATGSKDTEVGTISPRYAEGELGWMYRDTAETRPGKGDDGDGNDEDERGEDGKRPRKTRRGVWILTPKVRWMFLQSLRKGSKYAHVFDRVNMLQKLKDGLLEMLRLVNVELKAERSKVHDFSKSELGPEWEFEFKTGDCREMLTPEEWLKPGEPPLPEEEK